MSASRTCQLFMKTYAAIYLGTRWTTEHPWGVFAEDANGHAELLCIGEAYITAEDMDSRQEGQAVEASLEGGRLKIRVLT